nr:hypothetical protein StreXyl84_41380 [Streptomyces sp. Xyl84]
MIEPGEIPQFTGDLGLLEKACGDLKADAGGVRDAGGEVHSRFQGLSAYYRAPEAEQLFASTRPVKERADSFATGLESVSGALSGYAAEIRPLVKKLADLKEEATAFVASVKGDDDWEYDGGKVAHHNRIRDEVTRAVAAFWAAERTCHNKITALFHGTQMVAGDGSDRKDQYGFDAEDLKNAKLPWGDPVEEKHHWYEVGHWIKSFVWDGLIVDGVWGTVKGLGTLVGFGGWEAMGQAWKGLAQLATGLVISSLPGVGTLFWALPDDKLPSWFRDSRRAMKETGKALVAWDEWGKNPARAAGAVTFNVVTTVFTGGAGGAASGAGKAGAVAKALSVAGKAGRVIDPMTYVAKGAGAGLSKIGDISKALKGMGKIDIPELPENAITLPKGTVKLPDGSFRLPDGAPVPPGATRLPSGSFELPDDVPVVHDGAHPLHTPDGTGQVYGHPDGHIVDGNGNILIHADELQTPPAAGTDLPHTPAPVKEPVLAGAATHTASDTVDTAGHVGDHATGHSGDAGSTHHGGESHSGPHTNDGHGSDGHGYGSADSHGSDHHADAGTHDTDAVDHGGHGEDAHTTQDPETSASDHLPDGEAVPGQSGGAVRPPDDGSVRSFMKNEEWAGEAYDAIRAADDVDAMASHLSDVPRLDGNTGFTRDEIQAIKEHVFTEEHPLESVDGGIVHARYDPNPDMAEAWIRLRSGTHTDADLLLLEHELAEHRYYQDHPGSTYAEAHAAATKIADWASNMEAPRRENYTWED